MRLGSPKEPLVDIHANYAASATAIIVYHA